MSEYEFTLPPDSIITGLAFEAMTEGDAIIEKRDAAWAELAKDVGPKGTASTPVTLADWRRLVEEHLQP